MRTQLLVARRLFALCLLSAGVALADGGSVVIKATPVPAQEAQPPAPRPGEAQLEAPPLEQGADAPAKARAEPGDDARISFGLLVTPISAPRPVAVELLVRGPWVGLSGGYSSFPGFMSATLLTVAGANSGSTTFSLDDFHAWSVEGRAYPFRGAFYLGASGGYQHLSGTLTRTYSSTQTGNVTETAHVDVGSWFLAPRLGWMWRAATGLTLGVGLGVQLTLSSDQVVDLPPGTSATIQKNADNLVKFAASLPLPVVDLRMGYLF